MKGYAIMNKQPETKNKAIQLTAIAAMLAITAIVGALLLTLQDSSTLALLYLLGFFIILVVLYDLYKKEIHAVIEDFIKKK
jgi:uncharacterized membrane protein YfcA